MVGEHKYCVIVDGYSSGNLLAPEFNARGVKCIHVLSSRSNEKIMAPSFNAADFWAFHIYDENLPALVEALEKFEPICVVPGTETGVPLADALSERLAVPSNGSALSEMRRNKFLMAARAAEAGVPVAQQIKASAASEIISWFGQKNFKKIVIKPLNSAGTDGFAICESAGDIEKAVVALVGKKNKLGILNDEVLAQEFLAGTEYFVNTVSRDGQHRCVEVWRYKKRSINGHDAVYDSSRLCEFEDPVAQEIFLYVTGVLDALGIKHGPAHTEVMLTSDGPRLIETGARLDGLCVPSLSQACVGQDQVQLTAQAYLEPRHFLENIELGFAIQKHAINVHLATFKDGTVKSTAQAESARKLSSFFQMKLRAKPGAAIQKTVDWFTTIGFVSLAHPDADILVGDYEQLRAAEAAGLVEFE